MNKYSVNPDRVDEVAQQFAHAGHDCSDTFTTLNMALHSLEAEWTGPEATRFFHDFQDFQLTTRQVVELLDGVGTHLQQIAHQYRSADQAH